VTSPVAGLIRAFCSPSLVRRMASAMGLKSKPNDPPKSAGVNGPVPTAVTLPVREIV